MAMTAPPPTWGDTHPDSPGTASGSRHQQHAVDPREARGQTFPARPSVRRGVHLAVGGPERGEGPVGDRLQAEGVDVVVEPLGQPRPAPLEAPLPEPAPV